MDARENELLKLIEDLREHPCFLLSSQISLALLSVKTIEEANRYPDSSLLFAFDAETHALQRRILSIRRLVEFTTQRSKIGSRGMFLSVLYDAAIDSIYVRLASLPDISCLLVRTVWQASLTDIESTPRRVIGHLPNAVSREAFGRLTAPQRKMRQRRHLRVHSGLEEDVHGYQQAFDMAGVMGLGMKIMTGKETSISVQELMDRRMSHCFDILEIEMREIGPNLTIILDEMENEINKKIDSLASQSNTLVGREPEIFGRHKA